MSPFTVPILGRLPWIDLFLIIWFFLVALSLIYVTWDVFTKTPENKVMKWAWVLATLYTGPLALSFYILADKEPKPGTHEEFIKPMWKQALGSTLHCAAGDATGVIVAAFVTGLYGTPMGFDLIVEYVAGFTFGLFIFQALFMKSMYGSYKEALKKTILPEWLSMNTMMAGMFPAMVYLMMGRDMRAMDPREFVFWGAMSLSIGVGVLTAYPINWWLVRKGLKHGLMTVREGVEKKMEM